MTKKFGRHGIKPSLRRTTGGLLVLQGSKVPVVSTKKKAPRWSGEIFRIGENSLWKGKRALGGERRVPLPSSKTASNKVESRSRKKKKEEERDRRGKGGDAALDEAETRIKKTEFQENSQEAFEHLPNGKKAGRSTCRQKERNAQARKDEVREGWGGETPVETANENLKIARPLSDRGKTSRRSSRRSRATSSSPSRKKRGKEYCLGCKSDRDHGDCHLQRKADLMGGGGETPKVTSKGNWRGA